MSAPSEEQVRRLVGEAHFRLLKEFGRNTLQQQLSDKERGMLWQLSCKQAQLAVVPQEIVVDVWKEFVSGESVRSGIAINGDIDANFTVIGVMFDQVLVATHTTKTKALLERVLRIWRRGFQSDDAYMEAVEKMAVRALGEPRKKVRKS